MKKILLLSLVLIGFASISNAGFYETYQLNSASYTATNETTKVIPRTYPGTVLIGVLVSSSAAGTITIYDSSGTANNTLATLGSQQNFYAPFEVRLSSGLTYTTASNTNGFTLIFKRMRPE